MFIWVAITARRLTTILRRLPESGGSPAIRSKRPRSASPAARLVRSIPGAWNMDRARWVRVRSWLIRVGARRTTFSIGASIAPSSCRLLRSFRSRRRAVFEVNSVNGYACRFMTITCDVRPAWRKRIAAVVHVDGSARPQTIARDANPLCYDVVSAFGRETGIPVLVNTSFNVHEEPIVNTPGECAKALVDGRIDFVVTQRAIYEADGSKNVAKRDRAVKQMA